ncbi:MAG: hypothetical protein FWE09_07635 [Treponema sp.]|nr:hypothetical protein [Treponema sp.]
MAAWLLTLAVFSGLSVNLVLQFGMGALELALAEKGAAKGADKGSSPGFRARLLEIGVFFASVLFLWGIFFLARNFLPLGFFEYVLVFPVGLVFSGALRGFLSGRSGGAFAQGLKAGGPFDGPFVAAALFVALFAAGGVLEAAAISLGFSLGSLIAVSVVAEIKKRSETENVRSRLRGAPLALIAMGLLSLVFSYAASVLLGALGVL